MPVLTQANIATRLKISRATVSRALRNYPGVSPKMRKKVRGMAEEIGYYNLHYKSMLGVVIPNFENSFFADMVRSIIDTAGEGNIVFITESQERQQDEISNIELLTELQMEGLLVCVSQQTRDAKIINHIRSLKIPIVFFDRSLEGLKFPKVVFDDKNGAIKALDKIIEQGYTKIAHFAGYSNVSIGRERYLGYKYALEKNGIEINPKWVIEGGFEIRDGYDSFIKLYNKKEIPEIIFTVNDRVALGVYQAAGEKGIRIPEDMGVAGFGFKETAQSFAPTLSIINQDPKKIGKAAAELLIEMIKNPDIKKSKNIKIEEEFIWNDSIIKKANFDFNHLLFF